MKFFNISRRLSVCFLALLLSTLSCIDADRDNLNDPEADNFVTPEIYVSLNDEQINSGDVYQFRKDVLGSFRDIEIKIENRGTSLLKFDSSNPVHISGENVSLFEIIKQPDNVLSPGAQASCIIRYTPVDVSEKTINVSFTENDLDEGEYTFTVKGYDRLDFYHEKEPFTGRSTVIKTIGNTVYAGIEGGSVYKSNDRGKNWVQVGSSLTMTIYDIETDGTWIYAGGFEWNEGTRKAKVMRVPLDESTDWGTVGNISAESAEFGRTVNNLLWDGTRLYAAMDKPAVLFLDDGDVWKNFGAGQEHFRNEIYSLTAFEGILYAGTEAYIGQNNYLVFKIDTSSVDNSWEHLSDFAAENGSRRAKALVCVKNGEKEYLYAGSEDMSSHSTYPQKVYRYSFSNGSWEDCSAGFSSTEVDKSSSVIKSFVKYNSDIYVSAYDGLYKLTHRDNISECSWERIDPVSSDKHPVSSQIAIPDDGTIVYATSDTGVYGHPGVSASTWGLYKNGISNSYILSITGDDNYLYLNTFHNGILKYDVSYGIIKDSFIKPDGTNQVLYTDNRLFAATTSGVYSKSIDEEEWTLIGTAATTPDEVRSIIINEGILYAGCETGLFSIALDGGEWKQQEIESEYVSDLLIYGKVIYFYSSWCVIGTDNYNGIFSFNTDSKELKIVQTFEDGTSFEGMTIAGNLLNFIKFYDTGENSKSVIWKYPLSGIVEAETIGRDIPTKCSGLSVYNDRLYMGTLDGRILRIKLNGEDWEEYADGIPRSNSTSESSLNCIYIMNETLFIGTKYNGLWRTK